MIKTLQGNLITRHTVLLDYSKLGYHTRAQVLIKVNGKDKNAMMNYLCAHENINSVFKINNGWDLIVEIVQKTNKDLDAFLTLLESKYAIEKTEIHYLIDQVKAEGFSPVPTYTCS